MRVRLSRRAARDLAELADDVTRVNPDAARSITVAIADAQRLISERPRIGRSQKGRDLREFVAPRYRHLIYCRVIDRDDVVAIATMRHPSRARIASDA